jgi:GTP pyrophosphokinase
MKEENIKTGKDMLEAEAKRKGFTLSQLFQPKWLEAVMTRFSFTSADDMYSAVGYGGITTQQILMKLIDSHRKENEKPVVPKPDASVRMTGDGAVIIKGSSGLLVKLARCCAPVPGDDIIGFISRGRGAVVHRLSCPNVKGLEPERLAAAEWAGDSSTFTTNIQILAEDKSGLIARIAGLLSDQKVSIASMNARVDKQRMANITVSVVVSQIGDLDRLFKRIQQMPEVVSVTRV